MGSSLWEAVGGPWFIGPYGIQLQSIVDVPGWGMDFNFESLQSLNHSCANLQLGTGGSGKHAGPESHKNAQKSCKCRQRHCKVSSVDNSTAWEQWLCISLFGEVVLKSLKAPT